MVSFFVYIQGQIATYSLWCALDYQVLFKHLSSKLNKKRKVKTMKWAVIYSKYDEWMESDFFHAGLWNACSCRSPGIPKWRSQMHSCKKKTLIFFSNFFLDFRKALFFWGSSVFSLRFSGLCFSYTLKKRVIAKLSIVP